MELNLFRHLSSFGQLTLQLQAHLGSILKYETYGKNAFLLKEGAINSKIWFIQKGLVAQYFYRDETQVVHGLLGEGAFVASIPSLITQARSKESILAIEDTITFYITRSELFDACESFPDLRNVILRAILQDMIFLKDHSYALRDTATQRYSWLLGHKAEIITRAPAIFMASYIGITPETFSKIKTAHYRKK